MKMSFTVGCIMLSVDIRIVIAGKLLCLFRTHSMECGVSLSPVPAPPLANTRTPASNPRLSLQSTGYILCSSSDDL